LKSNLYLISWIPSPAPLTPFATIRRRIYKAAVAHALGRLETRGHFLVERVAKGDNVDAGDMPMAASGLHHIRPSSRL